MIASNFFSATEAASAENIIQFHLHFMCSFFAQQFFLCSLNVITVWVWVFWEMKLEQKLLVKYTHVGSLTNTLTSNFFHISFHQKNINTNCKWRKASKKHLRRESRCLKNVGKIDTRPQITRRMFSTTFKLQLNNEIQSSRSRRTQKY
jgi:hypothetical protein